MNTSSLVTLRAAIFLASLSLLLAPGCGGTTEGGGDDPGVSDTSGDAGSGSGSADAGSSDSSVALDIGADAESAADIAVSVDSDGAGGAPDGAMTVDSSEGDDTGGSADVAVSVDSVVADLCADVVCPSTDASCDGTWLNHGSYSECNPASGECLQAPGLPPEDCAEQGLICLDGACVDGDDLCADVVCKPSVGTCDGDVAQAGAMTSCNPETGLCAPGALSLPKDCALSDQVCLDGECVDGESDTCTPGESFEADDGCNTCSCPDNGNKDEAMCTLMACPEECPEGACGPALGMPNYLCEDGITTAGPGDCEMTDDGICSWTVVTCPETDTCIPGESFLADDGCNTCSCPDSGNKDLAICTKMLCVCQTSADCGQDYFCDYAADDCGVWGVGGVCAAKPETCPAGGPGACGCGGISTTNDCEQNAAGHDFFQFGGCTLGEAETFACGETACAAATEHCAISMNDIFGPNEPFFYSSCAPLTDGCVQGDCSCQEVDEWSACYDGTGFTIVFYPGG